MQTVETTDCKEARRCRLAQFSGRNRTVAVSGRAFTGFVQSVRELKTSQGPTWTITIASRSTGQILAAIHPTG
jgi:hypothetical protein